MKSMIIYSQKGSDIVNKVYTVKEIANILKISVRTIYTLIEQGDIKTVRIGKSVRIKEEELQRILEGE